MIHGGEFEFNGLLSSMKNIHGFYLQFLCVSNWKCESKHFL